MLNYEEFKTELLDIFEDIIRDVFQEYGLEVENAGDDTFFRIENHQKVNQKKEEVLFFAISSSEEGKKFCPALKLAGVYNDFIKSGLSLDDFLRMVALSGVKAVNGMLRSYYLNPGFNDLDPKSLKKDIVFELVNTELNKDLLATVPHRDFLDLSVIYRWVVRDNKYSKSSIITNPFSELLNMNEEELFQLAMKNTLRKFPIKIFHIGDIYEKAHECYEGDFPDEYAKDIPFWVVCNENNEYGASALLYEDVFYSLFQCLGSNLYIIPSSIGECICIPEYMGDPAFLQEMLISVNRDVVIPEERLSNSLYFYDGDKREFSIFSDGGDV